MVFRRQQGLYNQIVKPMYFVLRPTAVLVSYARTGATTIPKAPTSTPGLLAHQKMEAAAMAVLTATTI